MGYHEKIDLAQMEWSVLFGLGEREDFEKDIWVCHSLPLQAKKDPPSDAMGLFEGVLFLSHKMEA